MGTYYTPQLSSYSSLPRGTLTETLSYYVIQEFIPIPNFTVVRDDKIRLRT